MAIVVGIWKEECATGEVSVASRETEKDRNRIDDELLKPWNAFGTNHLLY